MTEIMQIEINSVYGNEQLMSLEKVSNTLDMLEINLAGTDYDCCKQMLNTQVLHAFVKAIVGNVCRN